MIASQDTLTSSQASRGLKPARTDATSLTRGSPRKRPRRGFSLIELMVAIVILGLGLVMVATVFPVAWSRARKLSEFTSQQGITPAAQATVELVAGVAGPDFNSAGFAGDLIFDRFFAMGRGEVVSYSDVRVHALHLQNVLIGEDFVLVPEEPWDLEGIQPVADLLADPELQPGSDFLARSYYEPRLLFHQRIHPPMRARNGLGSSDEQEQWRDTLATRRFCWAVFHRLRNYVGPNPAVPPLPPATVESQAEEAITSSRTFDMYYVTLRRPNPTNRYARQDPASTPDPLDLTTPAATPAALPAADDVMFPVPWRVQVWLPENPPFPINATGIPTEIEVPARDATGAAMLINLFPSGSRFIDEITGKVYRVVKRRINADGDKAFLTLDREMVWEDVNLPSDYPPCGGIDCDPGTEDTERLRTVWVFPPAVEAARVDDEPVFKGPQPVVGIDVRTLTVPVYD